MRKRFLIYCLFPLAVLFTVGSCDVEPFSPIFYTISKEVRPIKPTIEGVPTDFAVFNNALFVASGKDLWEYVRRDKEYPTWEKNEKTSVGAPANKDELIIQIASTSNSLYALCNNERNSGLQTSLKRYGGSGWDTHNENNSIQHIFAAYDTLFIGVRIARSSNYNILYFDENENTIKELKHLVVETNDAGEETKRELDFVSGEISGAAYDGNGTYYICTKGKGIYKTASLLDENGTILVPDSTNIEFTGIINLKDNTNTIAAITRNGELYTVKDSVTKISGVSMDSRMATGTLTIWVEQLPDNAPPEQVPGRLLLAGRQDALNYSTNSGYTYGYMELELDENGIKGTRFIEPGKESLSTVDDNDLFISTIGKHPVNYIFQTPGEIDGNMTLFASTQQSGVWSYRVRGGKFQWNAEDNQHHSD